MMARRGGTSKRRWALALVAAGSLGITVVLLTVAFALPAAAQPHERDASPLHKGRALKAIASAIGLEQTALLHVPAGATLTAAKEEAVVEKYIVPSENDLERASEEVRSAIVHGEFEDTGSITRAIINDLEDALELDRFVQKLKYKGKSGLVFTGRKDLQEALSHKTAAQARIKNTLTSPPPSANSQTPCNNQNNYDPKFPDYTQLHEYCSKAVTGLTIHASVPLTGGGWFGPILNQPKCASVNSMTSTCVNITQLPKLTTFIVYASHPGGWPSGDTASATFTFDDGTKQTQYFYPH